MYGQPPGKQDPFSYLPDLGKRPTASSLATRSEGSGSGIPSPLREHRGLARAGPGHCADYERSASPTWSRVSRLPREDHLWRAGRPGCQQEGSGSSPAAPVAGGVGASRADPPAPAGPLAPRGAPHTPRPSRSPRAAAIAGHFLLPTGGGGPKRASPAPPTLQTARSSLSMIQSPAPEVEETRRAEAGQPFSRWERPCPNVLCAPPLSCARQCPPARGARPICPRCRARRLSSCAREAPQPPLRRAPSLREWP